jgi:disulfide bond formation protein DsbB
MTSMTFDNLFHTWTRHLPLILLLAGVGPLATAFFSQYVQGNDPCILCLYQRIPFAIVIVLGLIGLVRPAFAPVLGILGGIAFMAGMSVAFYHVGVEQHWWASAASCGGGLPEVTSLADFQKQLTVKPEKSCDSIDWTLFGISMATYNVGFSFVLAVLMFVGVAKLRKTDQG